MTDGAPELVPECARLQAALRLQDWSVTVDWAPPRRLPRDAYAHIEWVCTEQRATMMVRPEESIKRSKLRPVARGWVIAHELIHLKLEGHAPPNEALWVPAYEAGIDHLAELVYSAARTQDETPVLPGLAA
jgi:hypothetical protein